MPRMGKYINATGVGKYNRGGSKFRSSYPSFYPTKMRKSYGPAGRRMVTRNKKVMSSLKECSKLYALSLIDPSSNASRGACLPAGFPMPSQKARDMIRGEFQLGTSGIGFIQLRPSLANNNPAVRFTNSSSVGGPGDALSVFTPINLASFQALPYTIAQLAALDADGRIISQCVKVRYVGAEDKRNGTIVSLEDPHHDTLTEHTFDSIRGYQSAYTVRPPANGDWVGINWSGPCKQSEIEYQSTANQDPNDNTAAPLVVIIQGVAADQYEFEAWTNVEYIGRNTTGKTLSEVDSNGMNAVTSTTKAKQTEGKLNPKNEYSIMKQIHDTNATYIGETVSNAGRLAYGSWQVGKKLYDAYVNYGASSYPQITGL